MAAAGAVLSSLHATTHNARTEKGSVRMSVWVKGKLSSSLEHVTDTSRHSDDMVTTLPNERVGPSRSEQVVDVPDGAAVAAEPEVAAEVTPDDEPVYVVEP